MGSCGMSISVLSFPGRFAVELIGRRPWARILFSGGKEVKILGISLADLFAFDGEIILIGWVASMRDLSVQATVVGPTKN